MDFLFPLTAIISETAGKTVNKLNFAKNNISAMHLMRLDFVGMGITLLLYVLIAGRSFPSLSLVAFGLMLLVILVSFISNVCDDTSLKTNDLSLREPLKGFIPILAGLVGYLLFPSERKISLLIAFVLSTVVVYFGTHRRKLNTTQRKGMVLLLICVICEAFLPSIYKQTLQYVSPEFIALFRVAGILLLASIFFPIKKHMKSSSKLAYGLTSGFIYAIGTVASLYAIQKLGVVQTMLLLLLAPALMYLTSYFILKEKVRRGEVVSSLLLALIVLVAIVV